MELTEADLERRAAEIMGRLRERLAPEDFELVRRLRHLDDLATVATCTAWEQRMLDALVRHFPEHELAIRAVATHVRATNADCDTLRGLGFDQGER